MEQEALLQLIDDYLDGKLSGTQRSKVEQDLQQDESFREQVELQRQLRAAYVDPGRFRLRSVLQEIIAEEQGEEEKPLQLQTAKPTQRWRLYLLLGALLIAIGLMIWWASKRSTDVPSAPTLNTEEVETSQGADPQQQGGDPIEIPPVPETEQEGKNPEILPGNTSPEEEEEPVRPPVYAAADPADFLPNPSLEATVNGFLRSGEELSVELAKPIPDAAFTYSTAEILEVEFAGKVTGLANLQEMAGAVLVFNNKDPNNPIAEGAFSANTTSPNLAETLSMSAKPGLYYYVFETEEGDLLTAGRFTVREIQ